MDFNYTTKVGEKRRAGIRQRDSFGTCTLVQWEFRVEGGEFRGEERWILVLMLDLGGYA